MLLQLCCCKYLLIFTAGMLYNKGKRNLLRVCYEKNCIIASFPLMLLTGNILCSRCCFPSDYSSTYVFITSMNKIISIVTFIYEYMYNMYDVHTNSDEAKLPFHFSLIKLFCMGWGVQNHVQHLTDGSWSFLNLP